MTRRIVGGVPAGAGPVVLVLHGGAADSHRPPGLLAYLRMLPFAWALRRSGLTTRLLRYRYRGWNGADRDAYADVLWALEQLGPRPVLLVGHSLGGRAALHAGGEPSVAGVAALAPWIEPGDPWQPLAGRPVLLAHGSRDTTTDPARSREWAELLGARYVELDDDHAMLRHPGRWHTLVRDFATEVLAPVRQL
ncbi:hypothetical protein Lfu02_64240 [Longispora fulva]|uniref:Pimeloyl-ACP methyl ester carboxylesterase n=1 Tax=Longispora fulva TaxID=619741 RepID=A0A8J7KGV1_9ACTN|nr:alpha/beta fold hydrolase [Longispora fulva]MBG6137790.1 pimeloyl-ACP methyl ester carboxylesterase [Longispora fulva]GIG62052.1 hypothetical protein Lfu02_64240 [Longispora fulva]